MTTKTVEVERTVTDEEEMCVCDYCGRDEDGRLGELVPYVRASDDDVENRRVGIDGDSPYCEIVFVGDNEAMHLHERCEEDAREKMGVEPTTWEDVLGKPVVRVYSRGQVKMNRFGTFSLLSAGVIATQWGVSAATIGVSLLLIALGLTFWIVSYVESSDAACKLRAAGKL